MTECLGGTMLKAHQHMIDGSEAERGGCRRRASPISERKFASIGRRHEAKAGEIGEMLPRSPAIMSGYWNNPAASAEVAARRLVSSRRTSAMSTSDGFLFIVDRMKDMIISGGENIYSWEVEEALRAPSCRRRCGGDRGAGPQVGRGGQGLRGCARRRRVSADELIEYCRARIASYKKPRSVDFPGSAAVVQRQDRQEGLARPVLRARAAGVLEPA